MATLEDARIGLGTPAAMLLEVRGVVELRPRKGAAKQAARNVLLFPGDRLSLAAARTYGAAGAGGRQRQPRPCNCLSSNATRPLWSMGGLYPRDILRFPWFWKIYDAWHKPA